MPKMNVYMSLPDKALQWRYEKGQLSLTTKGGIKGSVCFIWSTCQIVKQSLKSPPYFSTTEIRRWANNFCKFPKLATTPTSRWPCDKVDRIWTSLSCNFFNSSCNYMFFHVCNTMNVFKKRQSKTVLHYSHFNAYHPSLWQQTFPPSLCVAVLNSYKHHLP